MITLLENGVDSCNRSLPPGWHQVDDKVYPRLCRAKELAWIRADGLLAITIHQSRNPRVYAWVRSKVERSESEGFWNRLLDGWAVRWQKDLNQFGGFGHEGAAQFVADKLDAMFPVTPT